MVKDYRESSRPETVPSELASLTSASGLPISALFSHGFSFRAQPGTMCLIGGSDGPCRVEAFVAGEHEVDPAGYTCSKLGKASYTGHCVRGALEGVSLVIADGTTKSFKEAFLSYFWNGRIAYPALSADLDERHHLIGLEEKNSSYGCINFGKWDHTRDRGDCEKLMTIYGPEIFSESTLLRLKDGTFNLTDYSEKFLRYVLDK